MFTETKKDKPQFLHRTCPFSGIILDFISTQ
jgi:hypothetical protein